MKKRTKTAEFGETPTEVPPSPMQLAFMQWLEAEVQSPMKDPLEFGATSRKSRSDGATTRG